MCPGAQKQTEDKHRRSVAGSVRGKESGGGFNAGFTSQELCDPGKLFVIFVPQFHDL